MKFFKAPSLDQLIESTAIAAVVVACVGLGVLILWMIWEGLERIWIEAPLVPALGITTFIVALVVILALYGFEKATGRW